jgi:sarcosine oxidase subunit beta
VDVAIVGGGIMGLALAYNLALARRRGGRAGGARVAPLRIAVLEASTLASGASGRNGGGLRQQWSTELNIRLMQESLELCAGFAADMGVNVWMRRGGYLFLVRSETTRAELERSIALQNLCDVPTRLISPAEASGLVPELDVRPFIAASYNPTDAVVFPWPFLWGYAEAAMRLGVTIHTETRVTAIARAPGSGAGDFTLRTTRGTLIAGRVVNAAGAWSPEVAALLGVELPNWPARHEILSTEALKPFLGPMVSVLESGLYVSQSLRGELVGGITLAETPDAPDPETPGETPATAPGPRPRPRVRLGSRLRFLEAMSAGLLEVMPRLGNIKVVRQWAGPYDLTQDGNPICGEVPGVPGFFVCCGFMGHGFMMAPVVARYYARHLRGEGTHPLFHAWRLSRFAEGDLESENMNIG